MIAANDLKTICVLDISIRIVSLVFRRGFGYNMGVVNLGNHESVYLLVYRNCYVIQPEEGEAIGI